MIKENQKLLNRLNVISDGVLSYIMLPVAYWLRFRLLPGGIEGIPFINYLRLGVAVVLIQLFTNAFFGIYTTSRKTLIRDEVYSLLRAGIMDAVLLLGLLFLGHDEHYSRWLLAIYVVMSTGIVVLKHIVTRRVLHAIRRNGNNLKHIILAGSGSAAEKYLKMLQTDRELGYKAVGYVAPRTAKGFDIPYLGGYEALDKVLERYDPDEVISAIDMEDYGYTPQIVNACETAGIKLAIVPFYADYMPPHPEFDELGGIPLMNIRRIPLDNFANAFLKRIVDVVGSVLLLLVTSPVLIFCAIGVKLSSPGPVLFRQERIGLNKKPFQMYKFRSMYVNDSQDSAWSTKVDLRRTGFGAFLRKYSLDELPQLFCVLIGTMSLVGPRPELPHFVDKFKDEIPLYMVRHQVRPGISGWAQINGFRGDTPIKERVEHDIYYIENWSILMDIHILLSTVFKGKFINDEQIG